MAKIPGTNVASTIAPFTTDDQFPTHDAIYGKGGQREVATIAERDAIPTARLTEGCTCYVAATEKTYRWKSNTWVDDTPEIASDASDIDYTPSGSGSTPTTVASALDSLNESVSGLEDSVQDNAGDIADLQEGAVAVDVDTTTKVFAIKNAKGQDVGTITVGTGTGGSATLTLAKAGTNGQDINVVLPTLAYNSQTQMLEYVDATGTHVPTVKLSNLTIKYVGSTDPSTGDWALGDLILVGSNSSYELKVYDGNSTWQPLGSINNVSLVADQVAFDKSTNGFNATNVQGAIEEVNDKFDEVVKTSELSVVEGTNLADPSLIVDNGHVSNTGSWSIPEGYKSIVIPVIAGNHISFGGFTIGTTRSYYSFYSNESKATNTIVGHGQFNEPNGGVAIENLLVPEDAIILAIEIKSANSSESVDYSHMMINYGATLLEYEPYSVCINKIQGKDLKVPYSQIEKVVSPLLQSYVQHSELSEYISDNDLTIEPGKNLADKTKIENGYITNVGGKANNENWKRIKIPVKPNTTYTFGGFYLGGVAYFAFYDANDTLIAYQQTSPNPYIYSDPLGFLHPKTVTSQSNAAFLYVTIKRPESTAPQDWETPYDELMICEGDTLPSYEPFALEISKIKGYAIKGSNNSGGGGGDGSDEETPIIENLLADLPVSDGTNIETGYAYIDSTTHVIKVKI